MFSLTLALMLGFLVLMLRPFLKSLGDERRRVAELLSNLPPEVQLLHATGTAGGDQCSCIRRANGTCGALLACRLTCTP